MSAWQAVALYLVGLMAGGVLGFHFGFRRGAGLVMLMVDASIRAGEIRVVERPAVDVQAERLH